MKDISTLLIQLSAIEKLDWETLTQLLHIKVKAQPTLDDNGKIDIFEYRPEILKSFKPIDVSSFVMTTLNQDPLNPPIEKLILDGVFEIELFQPLKQALLELKLDGMKLETIRKNEILSYKKLFINFTEPEISYGPRPEWASRDWTSADLVKLSTALKNYLQNSTEEHKKAVVESFELAHETSLRKPYNDDLAACYENSMFMIDYKNKTLTLNFFRGPTVFAVTEALQLEMPTLATARRSRFSLKLTYTAIPSLYQKKTDDDDELPIEIFAEELNGAASMAANKDTKSDDEIFYDFSQVIVKQIVLHEKR